MEKLEISYKTRTGNLYPLELGWTTIPTNLIPYNKNLTDEACRSGCNLYNRNGGCPPFSPDFNQLIKGREVATFIYAKLYTENYPLKILKGNFYIKWSFIEALLTPFLNKFEKCVNFGENSIFLSSGFCRKCRNKRCAVKDGNECRKPSERNFSLESTGVLVTDSVEKFFDFQLFWWDKNDYNYIPPYMTKVVALIGNQTIDNSEIFSILEGA
jgi:predicted metal-binding protein